MQSRIRCWHLKDKSNVSARNGYGVPYHCDSCETQSFAYCIVFSVEAFLPCKLICHVCLHHLSISNQCRVYINLFQLLLIHISRHYLCLVCFSLLSEVTLRFPWVPFSFFGARDDGCWRGELWFAPFNGSAILITMISAFFLGRQCHGFSFLYTNLLYMSGCPL